MRWDKKNIPHKGWIEIGIEDLGEEAEFGEKIQYEQCEMCGNEKIRYVHIMKHPEFRGELRVGRTCAGHMTDDYENSEFKEKELKNRVQRKKNFMKKEWRQVVKTGNYTLKYKGEHITIMRSKYGSGWGVIYAGKRCWEYHGKKIYNFDTARLVAFNLFDEMYNSSGEAQPYWDGVRWIYQQ